MTSALRSDCVKNRLAPSRTDLMRAVAAPPTQWEALPALQIFFAVIWVSKCVAQNRPYAASYYRLHGAR
jgi:hypothetical protein